MELINEAKRFQELAGINEVKILAPGTYKSDPEGNITWWLPNDRRDPNQLIQIIEDDEDIPQDEDEYGPYNKPWLNHGSLVQGINNTFYDVDNSDYTFSGYIEGKDYVKVDIKNIVPLLNVFGGAGYNIENIWFGTGYANYLDRTDGVLETNTPYWEKLVKIVGEENMPEYIKYLKSLGIKIGTKTARIRTKQNRPLLPKEIIWIFKDPRNPNEDTQQLKITGKDEEGENTYEVVDEITKRELWKKYNLGGIEYKNGMRIIDKFDDGTVVMWSDEPGYNGPYDNFKEGKDFIKVPLHKIKPLLDVYDINIYLELNYWRLDLRTEEGRQLVKIVGEENMPEYRKFLESLGIHIW
jgi:hypothetical protein